MKELLVFSFKNWSKRSRKADIKRKVGLGSENGMGEWFGREIDAVSPWLLWSSSYWGSGSQGARRARLILRIFFPLSDSIIALQYVYLCIGRAIYPLERNRKRSFSTLTPPLPLLLLFSRVVSSTYIYTYTTWCKKGYLRDPFCRRPYQSQEFPDVCRQSIDGFPWVGSTKELLRSLSMHHCNTIG